jgi:hypothetical protein
MDEPVVFEIYHNGGDGYCDFRVTCRASKHGGTPYGNGAISTLFSNINFISGDFDVKTYLRDKALQRIKELTNKYEAEVTGIINEVLGG